MKDPDSAAEKILKQKAFIRREIETVLSKEKSDALWHRAQKILASILLRYAGLSGGIRMHTDRFIFPSAAIYMALKDAIGADPAFQLIQNCSNSQAEKIGTKLAGMMKLPGFPSFFIFLWGPISHTMFSHGSGFQNRFYPWKKGEYRMDILACPYHRLFTELGCPELTKIFCDNDICTYGSLPGISFHRTGTIGSGADHCDFLIRKQ